VFTPAQLRSRLHRRWRLIVISFSALVLLRRVTRLRPLPSPQGVRGYPTSCVRLRCSLGGGWIWEMKSSWGELGKLVEHEITHPNINSHLHKVQFFIKNVPSRKRFPFLRPFSPSLLPPHRCLPIQIPNSHPVLRKHVQRVLRTCRLTSVK
jgi:hypothetical protein